MVTIPLGPSKKYELCLSAGSDFDFICLLTNEVDSAIDISPDEVIFTVKDYKGGTEKIQKTNPPYSHFDGPGGRTLFHIDPTDIAIATPPRNLAWVFEVRRILPSGLEYVHIEGDFSVSAEVGQ
jgi:hypothetical protein